MLLTVVLSFVTVFLFCLRRLDNIGANVMQWFKLKKLRLPTEVHLPRSTIALPSLSPLSAIKSTFCQIKSANQRAKVKIAVTVTAVFFSFVLRATYAVMLALSACAPPHPCAQWFIIPPIVVTTTCTTTIIIIIHQRCRSVWSTEARCNNDPCHRCFSDLKLVCARSSYS